MSGKEFSHLHERVGPPESPKDVEVKLHDAVYNFGRAKYLGLDAHLGAICVVNGWLDKVKVHVDEKTGKATRSFKLPYIHEGDHIKLPEAGQLKELDKQAFKYWNEKYPANKKAEPRVPKTPENKGPKGEPTPGTGKENPAENPSGKPEASGQGKLDHDIVVAKKVAQDLQSDLLCKQTCLDKSVGNVFGHGADAWENLFDHGSNAVRKDLSDKQNGIKALGKYANEGKLDDFAKAHKALTGVDFDPNQKQTARLNMDLQFNSFNKNHTSTVENLTEAATLAANWALSAYLGKAKGIGSFMKQGLLMTGFGGAVKTGAKALEHGNFSTGAEDFRSGAVSGLAFFAGDKVMHGVDSKFKAQTLPKYLLRGFVSGGTGGAAGGAIEGVNVGYAHARNEGRNYDVWQGANDSLKGIGAGFAGGALLGTISGGLGYRFKAKPVEIPEQPKPVTSIGGTKGSPELGGPNPQAEAPQPHAPKQQAEAPKQEAEAPKQEAEAPKQESDAPESQAEVSHNLKAEVVDRAKLAVRAMCESTDRDWGRAQELMFRDMARVCHPDAHVFAPTRLAAAENVLKKLGTLRDLMRGKNVKVFPTAAEIDHAKQEVMTAWQALEQLL
ncbi:MAG: hypothetical protein K2Y22_13835 [Candidatus Obscuribacterales bacterium]|nr:hypothetical protein [Candidatus Obscuribacterales bacterium]